MARAPFQTLVIPYRQTPTGVLYAVFRRSDGGYWQWIAGGGEDDETPLDAAKREASEEAGIPHDSDFLALDSRNTVPVVGVTGELTWGPDVLVIPEHCFGVKVQDEQLTLGKEHVEYRWVDHETAREMLHWDSNRNALQELNHRLTGHDSREVQA